MLKFHKVTVLPGTLDADSVYAVINSTLVELYITSSAGVARAVFSTSLTNAAVDARINALNVLVKVADIAARNALTLTTNAMVLVVSAIGDGTVTAGAALYFYDHAANSFTKVAEYESMDVVTTWANISGKPTSSPAQIDDAVSKVHTHANKSVLDALSDSAGALLYGGNPVSTQWTTNAW